MSDVDSPKVLWELIKARYGGADRVKEARLQILNSEVDRLKKHETETIDIFAGKLAGIALKSASLGEVIDESKLVKKLLKVVPRRFIHLVASLEQVLDLKSVGFEDVVGRLKAYEERIRGDDGGDEQQKVIFTRFNDGSGAGSSNGNSASSGGVFVSGCSGFSKGKGKWGKGKSEGFNNRDGSGGSSGSGSSKAQSIIKPNKSKSKPNDQPILIPKSRLIT